MKRTPREVAQGAPANALYGGADMSKPSTSTVKVPIPGTKMYTRRITIDMVAPEIWTGFLLKIVTADEGCWSWQGGERGGNYPMCWVPGIGTILAHRIVYLMTRGELPPGKLILHKCDNRRCVRPDHLYAGTHSDNVKDAWDRDPRWSARRYPCGDDHHLAKLKSPQVREVRRLLADGVAQKEIAEKFGVNVGVINSIRIGKTWRHLK